MPANLHRMQQQSTVVTENTKRNFLDDYFLFWMNTKLYIYEFVEILDVLTHVSLALFLWDIGNQRNPRSDATERGV